MEFLVDFGSVAQSITFAVLGNGDIAGDLEVFEVLANGTASSLGTLTGATTNWSSDSTFTTSSRSGVVRIRVLADTANLSFDWTAILPSTASIQAYSQFTVTGSLVADGETLHHFTVDFGATANTVMVQFSNFVDTGSFDAAFFNPDDLATGGMAAGVIPLTSEVLFLSGQGVTDFLFSLNENSGAAATYDITVDVSVAPGGLSLVESKTFGATRPFQSLFGLAVVGDESPTGAGTITREFNVDFGGTLHTADIWFQCDGPTGVTAELFEISSGGSPVSLSTLAPAGTNAEANVTSSSRTGTVKFRIEITTTGAADVSFAVVFDSTVTVASFGPGGGGGGGGSDSSCSTGTEQGWALLLLAAMSAVAVALRTRRTAL